MFVLPPTLATYLNQTKEWKGFYAWSGGGVVDEGAAGGWHAWVVLGLVLGLLGRRHVLLGDEVVDRFFVHVSKVQKVVIFYDNLEVIITKTEFLKSIQ